MSKDIDKLMDENTQLVNLLSNFREREGYLSTTIQKIETSKAWKLFKKIEKLTQIKNNILDKTKKFIPVKVRKHISGAVTKYIKPINKTIIEENINAEWNQWKNCRKDDSLDILVFSIISYDYRIQRPQHLAMELAKKGHRVFYIQNEFIPLIKHFDYSPIKVSKKADNLYLVTLSASRNLFIYSDKVSEKDKRIISGSIKTLIKAANILNPVAKIDHPFWSQLIGEIAMPAIYDCMDEHGGFSDSGLNITSLEEKLFNNCDMVLTSSDFLYEKVKNAKVKNILMLKNAGEYGHFSVAANKSLPIPNDIKYIRKPILGYYGAIAEWFDAGVIEAIAKKYSKVSIVLIGRVTNSNIEKLASKYNNIYLLGEKKYDDLPAYLQEFDVCLIPFIINDLIKATCPVKIFEYLAAGKPVVSMNIPELKYYKDSIYISNTEKEFLSNVSKALKGNGLNINERQNIARENTWEKRGKILVDKVKKTFFPKVSVIILSYNNSLVTHECIESLYTRSFYPNLETIVIDNASDKDTLNEIARLQKKYEFMLIKNRENLGFAAGNNIGLKNAKGDYLILLNNDTIVTPGWISRLIYHVKKDKVGLVGPVTNSIGNEAKIFISYNPLNNNSIEKAALEYTSVHWGQSFNLEKIAAFCWIMSKKIYKKIGGFDERFGKALFEDDDYCLRIKKGGYNILVSDDVFIHHWGGITSKWKSPEYQKLLEENKKKLENKWKMKWVPHKIRRNGFIEIIKYKLASFNDEKNTSVFKR